jgi:hypothetical protein
MIIQIQVKKIAGVRHIEVVAETRWTSNKRQVDVVQVIELHMFCECSIHPDVGQVLHVIKNVTSINRQVVGNQKIVIGRQRNCLHELQPETKLVIVNPVTNRCITHCSLVMLSMVISWDSNAATILL